MMSARSVASSSSLSALAPDRSPAPTQLEEPPGLDLPWVVGGTVGGVAVAVGVFKIVAILRGRVRKGQEARKGDQRSTAGRGGSDLEHGTTVRTDPDTVWRVTGREGLPAGKGARHSAATSCSNLEHGTTRRMDPDPT